MRLKTFSGYGDRVHMGKLFGWLIVIGIGVWFVIGSPLTAIADRFWSDKAAPWEKVDAFFYPNRSNLTIHKAKRDLRTVDECRNWVKSQASEIGDLMMAQSDYECGVGKLQDFGDIAMYRLTVR